MLDWGLESVITSTSNKPHIAIVKSSPNCTKKKQNGAATTKGNLFGVIEKRTFVYLLLNPIQILQSIPVLEKLSTAVPNTATIAVRFRQCPRRLCRAWSLVQILWWLASPNSKMTQIYDLIEYFKMI